MARNEEVERIKIAYAKRVQLGKDQLYSKFSPGSLYNAQQTEKIKLHFLKENGFDNLEDKRILDVGCGRGAALRDFIQLGAIPNNLNGIDLIPERIAVAKRLSPNIKFYCGNAENMPFEDGSFDLILCFVTFSSILEKAMKENVAKEMKRALTKGGIILWYDFFVNNPWNPDVQGIGKREISRLFPGCQIELKKISLIPQLYRVLARYSWLACYLLERIPWIRTHYFGVIRKGKSFPS